MFLVFGLPGQPWYRAALGTLLPPPVIRFRNYTWYAPQILEVDITNGANHRAQGNKTFGEVWQELEPRIKRFRYAIEAVEMGLPPDAFEQSTKTGSEQDRVNL